MLDLNLLRVFDMVMTERNLTRAADRLAMTQPAVSNALRRLRAAMNDTLLVRDVHGVRPTERAEQMWPAVRRSLSMLEEALRSDSFDIMRDSATFRLSMPDGTASIWLPPLLRTLRKAGSRITVQMIPLTTRDPRPMLHSGTSDIVLGSFPGVMRSLEGDSETPIRHQRLHLSRYVCVMRKHHPLSQSAFNLDDYCSANHLLVSFSGRDRGLIDEALSAVGRKRHVLLTVNQYATAGQVIASSDLVTVLPRHMIAATGLEEKLEWRELPLALPEVSIHMLWHAREAKNAAHAWLRKELVSLAAESYAPYV